MFRKTLLCSSLLTSAAVAAEGKPNIVCIFTDDSAVGYWGAYGNRMPTPALNRLAAEGMRFDAAFTPSPACTPSRYALLTGQFPSRCTGQAFLKENPHTQPANIGWNTPILASDITIARVLQRAGYYTGFIGKWHNFLEGIAPSGGDEHDHPLPEDWPQFSDKDDPNDPAVNAGLKVFQRKVADAVKLLGGFEWAGGVQYGNLYNLPGGDTRQHHFEWLAHYASTFLDQAVSQDRPFFLYLATTAVHGPDHAEKLACDPRYTPEGIMTEHLNGTLPPRESYRQRLEAAGLPFDSDHAGVLLNDDLVEAVLKKLDELGLSQNTLIVVMADHGAEPSKATTYDRGCQIPMIMRWPGRIAAGSISTEQVSLVDMMPTFAEAAGTTAPADGISLLDHMTRNTPLPRESIYMEFGWQRAVRMNNGLKYIAFRYPQKAVEQMRSGECKVALDNTARESYILSNIAIRYLPAYFDADQLFDTAVDPWELNNLAADPLRAEELKTVQAALEHHIAALPHPFPLDPVPFMQSELFLDLKKARQARDAKQNWWHNDFAWPGSINEYR